MNQFLITADPNGNRIFIQTKYNKYEIVTDKNKGTAIYHSIDNTLLICKQYYKENVNTAINFLLKEFYLFQNNK